MKNLFMAASLLLIVSATKAQVDTTMFYASSASSGFNRSFLGTFNNAYPHAAMVKRNAYVVDSAKTAAATTVVPDSTDKKTVKQFVITQESASNYLVGTWAVEDSTKHLPPMSLTFDDSMHVKLVYAKEGAAQLSYTVDKYHDQIVLHFEGLDNFHVKKHMYWFIKVLDNKTIEAEQSIYGPRSYKWNEAIAVTVVKQS